MPTIRCYVDDRTLHILERGRLIEPRKQLEDGFLIGPHLRQLVEQDVVQRIELAL